MKPILAAFCLGMLAAAAFAADDQPLIVHEWGVAVRSSTTRGTLLGAPDELIGELPSFVQVLKNNYTPKRQDQGWDKPVIHLYGPDGLAVKVKVLTPQGRLTTYYPTGNLLENTITVSDGSIMMVYTLTDCVGLEWSGTLSNEPKKKLSEPKKDHWWNSVRRVPAAYLNMDAQSERFLFYEATAYQEPLVTAQVSGDSIKIKNAHTAASGRVLLLVNDGAKKYLKVVETIPASGDVTLEKADVLKTPAQDEEILAAAREQWESFGMTREEAQANVETWKPDLLGKPGFLMISRMPGEVYDRMFPLTVTPQPKEIVRAGVVFDSLPGNPDRLAWIPEITRHIDAVSAGLGNAEFEQRQTAMHNLARLGDLIEPYLEKLTRNSDAEVVDEAKRLIERLQPLKVPAALQKGRSENQFFVPRQK